MQCREVSSRDVCRFTVAGWLTRNTCSFITSAVSRSHYCANERLSCTRRCTAGHHRRHRSLLPSLKWVVSILKVTLIERPDQLLSWLLLVLVVATRTDFQVCTIQIANRAGESIVARNTVAHACVVCRAVRVQHHLKHLRHVLPLAFRLSRGAATEAAYENDAEDDHSKGTRQHDIPQIHKRGAGRRERERDGIGVKAEEQNEVEKKKEEEEGASGYHSLSSKFVWGSLNDGRSWRVFNLKKGGKKEKSRCPLLLTCFVNVAQMRIKKPRRVVAK